MPSFETIELSPEIGTEIVGLDLRSELADDDVAALRDLFARRHLLVLRGQELTAQQQGAFVGLFGEVADERMNGQYHTYISNVRGLSQADLRGELLWHSDSTTTPYPMLALCLYGEAVDGEVPNTRFASCARGYRVAPPALLEALEGLEVVNIATFDRDSEFLYSAERFAPRELPEDTYHNYRANYPVLFRHPQTGEMLLFASEYLSARLVGLDYDESEALLRQVFDVLYDPAFVFEHEWRQGDVVIWDNLALQHSREAFREGQDGTRDLRRVVVNPHYDDLLDYAPKVRDSLGYLEDNRPRVDSPS
jgi:alpha-ketoglutarate-dependent taurine dioxygenase